MHATSPTNDLSGLVVTMPFRARIIDFRCSGSIATSTPNYLFGLDSTLATSYATAMFATSLTRSTTTSLCAPRQALVRCSPLQLTER